MNVFTLRMYAAKLRQAILLFDSTHRSHFYLSGMMILLMGISFSTKSFTISTGNKPTSTLSFQDEIVVSGTVKDSDGPLPGASVSLKFSKLAVQANTEGKFSLKVPANGTLVFSMVGYKTKEVEIKGESKIDVVLESLNNLDEVAVVAFGTQKKSSILSAITTINPKELKVPSSNLTTALAGKLAGVIAYQRSGEPGQDNASFFIRGVTTFGYKKDPLILIDGIEVSATDLARLQPDDIASFSIMKDATATSLYGARGANGVILIVTKSGDEGRAKVQIRLENSTSQNTRDLEFADPITYMKLANEAVTTRNPLGIQPYLQNKIDQTQLGANPYIYPAIDWREMLIKNRTNNQRMNFNANGGGKIARYYIAGTYNIDNGLLKVDKRNNFNNNINLKSYQLRSNININMTKSTEVIVRLAGSFDDYTGPIDGGSGMYDKIMKTNPVMFPAYYPAELMPNTKHILFGNSNNGLLINPYADLVKGYRDYARSNMSAQFEVKQDLSSILNGLSARGLFNTSRYSYFDVTRNYNPFYYSATGYNNLTDTYNLVLLNEGAATEYLNYVEGAKDINTTTYMEAAVNYNKQIAKLHDVTGLLVFIRRQNLSANSGTLQKSLPYRNQGLSGRFTYGYDNRYLFEATFGYNGSERFFKTERYGFFPALGVGWTISNEKFWKPISNVVSKLRLKATYGIVGNDAIGAPEDRFFYLSEVNPNDPAKGSVFGEQFAIRKNGYTINRYDNPFITWERAKKFNFGTELTLFNDFNLQADIFSETRDNILMERAFIPTTMGLAATVKANTGKAKANGIDVSADYSKNFNSSLWLRLQGNFTYAHSEFLQYEEPEYKERYLSRVGQSLNQNYGLIAERLFIDQYDVSNSPRQTFGEYAAGDIKYRDVNGDGQITNLDKVPIGLPTVPEIIYGFGFSSGYKGVDFSVFFQGSARSSFWIDTQKTAPFISPDNTVGQNALIKAYADNHWSEDNQNLYALWPRLSNSINTNNLQTSTWFMQNGSFLRLKSAELGYSLPKKILNRIKLSNVRFYINGTNLMSVSGFKLWDIEMGGNGLGYPVQRVYNVGIQLGF